MRLILISIILFWGATACKNKYQKAADELAANAPAPINMNAGKEKYTVQIPNGWTTKNRLAYGIEYYFLLAPKTADDPNTTINIISEFMQNLSLDDYLAGTIQSIKKSIPSAAVVGQGEIVATGLKGAWYTYNMEVQGIETTIVSYLFPKNGVAYIITAGTQPKDAQKYRKTFDQVAESFKFAEE
jgi:hypothetical protein